MDVAASGHAAALWAGLHLVLLLVLSVLVVRQRRKHQVALGHADIPELNQAVRAFGEVYPIQPGMTLKAEIVLERQSFLGWLMAPINAVRHRT